MKTPTGKTIKDFTIPEKMLQDEELMKLIMSSESMDDNERQYWFNLYEVMNEPQIAKLKDILARERQKLEEIEKKYAKKKISPEEAARIAKEKGAKRAAHAAEVKKKEAAHEAKEKKMEEDVLAELENL